MHTATIRGPLALALLVICLPGNHSSGRLWAGERLVVHEWGTFTALQDDDGTALAGINVDDEPLPGFVHNLSQQILAKPNSLRNIFMKGVPQRHPYVTLRLETPVVYFYPPDGQSTPTTLNVHVDFRGGWLTQFYPQAEVAAPGLREGKFHFGRIDRSTLSALEWRGLQVGTQANLPKTDAPVWLAPRQVRAARLTAESGESEQYLFYRGVGNFPAPLRAVSDTAADTIALNPSESDGPDSAQTTEIGPLWLVEVRSDRQTAYRTLAPVLASSQQAGRRASARRSFAATDFSVGNIDRLSESMHEALVAAGLYDDEALAMLATWRQAYFCSPGLRLFFLVPRNWTDHVLPLGVSQPCQIQRVMVARVELISPAQRELLKQLSQVKIREVGWLVEARRSPNFARLLEGRSDIGDLGVKIPPHFQAYLDLGRFRNALVIAEQRQRPTEALASFINAYGLESFRQPLETDELDD